MLTSQLMEMYLLKGPLAAELVLHLEREQVPTRLYLSGK